MNNGKSTR